MNKSIALTSISIKYEAIKTLEAEIGTLKKIAYPGVLTDKTREEVSKYIAECTTSCMFGDGLEDDYVWDGCLIVGINELTDEELVEELLAYTSEDEDLYQQAKGELILEAVLAGEDVNE